MANKWSTVDDDELNFLDKTVDFLQGEFCPEGQDAMWSSKYFEWKLGASNPAGKGYLSIALINDNVVGCVSITKKRFLIDGCEYICGEIGDSYSSAAVRRRSKPMSLSEIDSNPKSYINRSIFGRLATEIRARAEQDGVNIIYGTPNNNAYPSWIKRLGYFDFRNYCNKSFSRPTTKYIVNKLPILRLFRFLLRGIEGTAIALNKLFYSQIMCRNFDFEVAEGVDNEIDSLWKKLKPKKGISLVRDAEYWRHRYRQHPLYQYSFFNIRKNGKLIGIVVAKFHVFGDKQKAVSIAEWMLEEKINFGYILSNVVSHYKNQDIDVFNLWLNESSLESNIARRNCFLSRRRVPIILSNTDQSRALEDTSSTIYFYLGSSDAI